MPGWTELRWQNASTTDYTSTPVLNVRWLRYFGTKAPFGHVFVISFCDVRTVKSKQMPDRKLLAPSMKIYEGNVFTLNVEKIRFIISRRYYSQSVPEKRFYKEQLAERTMSDKKWSGGWKGVPPNAS